MLVVNRLWASDSQKPIAMVCDSMGYRISGSRKESLSTQDSYFGASAARRTAEYHVLLLLAGLLISIIISKKNLHPTQATLKTRTSSILPSHPIPQTFKATWCKGDACRATKGGLQENSVEKFHWQLYHFYLRGFKIFFFQKKTRLFSKGKRLMISSKTLRFPTQSAWWFDTQPGGLPRRWGSFCWNPLWKKKPWKFVHPKDEMKIYEVRIPYML